MAKKRTTTAKRAANRPLVRLSERTTVRVRGRYDAAQTTDENYKHWANADDLSANAALSDYVRRQLRNRCRYEVANNSYAKGIGSTIANDTVGTGPQLQVLTKTPATNLAVETAFWQWAQEINLAEKLRLLRFARYDSGEAFAVMANNPGLKSPVKLDVWLLESEQIADPDYESIIDPQMVDGIRYDQYGNPVSYRMLKVHPGSLSWAAASDYEDLLAKFVFHYFHPDRPGQRRGIPDIVPAIQLFGELRRYTAAVRGAAETAADFALVLYNENQPDPENGTTEVEAMDAIELARRMATTLPQGYKLGQVRAEQPTTGHSEFTNTIIKEIARCISVPFTIAAMDSSIGNMSSAYVDRQAYAYERLIDRADLEKFLDNLKERWVFEASRIGGFLPQLPEELPHQWFWPSLGHHADPAKVANAGETELKAGLTTYPREYAKRGLDWEEQQESQAKALGITVAELRDKLCQNLFGPPPASVPGKENENEDEKSEDAEKARAVVSAINRLADVMTAQKPPVVNFAIPDSKELLPPVVNVHVPEQLRQEPPTIHVHPAEAAAPVVNVNVPELQPPIIHVNIPAVAAGGTDEKPATGKPAGL